MHLGWLIAKPADLGAWLEVGIPLVLALFYAIAQIFNRERKTPPPNKPSRPAARPMPQTVGNVKRAPAAPGVGRAATTQKSDPLLAEIQKFLKQANQPKPRPTGPQSPGGRPRIEVIPARSGSVVEDPPPRALDTLQGRHLDTAEVSASAAHLTDDMKRGDVEREQHFEQTFGHKLGSLTDTSDRRFQSHHEPMAPAASSRRNDLTPVVVALNLRTTPDDLLRAFMLNEVLQRPEHRW